MELEFMALIALAGVNIGLAMAQIAMIKKKKRKSKRRRLTQEQIAYMQQQQQVYGR